MRRYIAIILAALLWAGVAEGASISKTVCASGCDYTTLKGAVDYIRANGDGSSWNYINVGAGSFTSSNDYALLDNVTTLSKLQINGAGRNTTIIRPSSANSVTTTKSVESVLITNLTLSASGASRAISNFGSSAAPAIAMDNVDVMYINGTAGNMGNLVLMDGGTLDATSTRFFHQYDTTNYRNPVRFTGSAGGTFSYCLSMAAGQTKETTTWAIESTGAVNIYNSVLLDSRSHGILFSGAGTYSVKNSIITGGISTSDAYPIVRTNGTLTVANTLLIANPWNGDALWISGTYTDGGGNIFTSVNPKFRAYPRKGYIIPRVDDRGADANSGYQYAGNLAALLGAKGMKGLYCIEGINTVAGDYAALRSLVSGGVMEVASHSYTHSDMTLDNGVKIFDVAKGVETFTISRANDNIVASGGGAVQGFRSKTLAAIKAELEALGATVTPASLYETGSPAAGDLRATTLGEVIADGTATNQIDLLVDATGETGYFKTEMADQKTWLADTVINGAGNVTDPQTGATYAARSFCYPFNAEDAESRAATIALGFVTANGRKVGGAGTVADVPHLGDVDMFGLVSVNGSTYLKGENEAATRYNARALAFAAAHTGLVIEVLAHSTTEVPLADWGYAIDEWSNYGSDLHVTSAQIFRDTIAGSADWTDDEDGTFSRTYTNGTGDYRLSPGSPAINAGTNVGLTSDYLGNPIKGLPDIGAYEYQGGVTSFPGFNRSFPSFPSFP